MGRLVLRVVLGAVFYCFAAVAEEKDFVVAGEGSRCPPGYHPETRINGGLTIAGVVTGSAGAALVAYGVRDQLDARTRGYAPAFYIAGGVHLVPGLLMLAAGLNSEHTVYVRNREVAVSLVPDVGPKRAGAVVDVRF